MPAKNIITIIVKPSTSETIIWDEALNITINSYKQMNII